MYMYAYTCTCVHVDSWRHTCTHAHMRTCRHAYMHTGNAGIQASTHPCIHPSVHACMHTYAGNYFLNIVQSNTFGIVQTDIKFEPQLCEAMSS